MGDPMKINEIIIAFLSLKVNHGYSFRDFSLKFYLRTFQGTLNAEVLLLLLLLFTLDCQSQPKPAFLNSQANSQSAKVDKAFEEAEKLRR